MLTIILKILGIVGMILLVALCVVLALVLLVLFVPITYKVLARRRPEIVMESGAADGQEKTVTHVSVKMNWLLGFLRVRFMYPEPGKLTVKILFFKLFETDGSGDGQDDENGKKERRPKHKKRGRETKKGRGSVGENINPENAERREELGRENVSQEALEGQEESGTAGNARQEVESERARNARQEAESEAVENARQGTEGEQSAQEAQQQNNADDASVKSKVVGVYDKIKDIRSNVGFYKDLIKSDDSRELLNHAFMRFGKIFKNIRPRKLRVRLLFGTGSPDTTGYLLGVYGMMSPFLGKHVNITPDFERAVLEGEGYAAGHITVFKLLWNGLMLVFDKRLKRLVKKVKTKDQVDA